jgi:hypothetical protein
VEYRSGVLNEGEIGEVGEGDELDGEIFKGLRFITPISHHPCKLYQFSQAFSNLVESIHM